MAVEVHVEGRIELGRLHEFFPAAQRYAAHARTHGHGVPRVLHALSGDMNTIRMVFRYPDLAAYERDEASSSVDAEYARIAGEMPFVDGTLRYSIYRAVEE